LVRAAVTAAAFSHTTRTAHATVYVHTGLPALCPFYTPVVTFCTTAHRGSAGFVRSSRFTAVCCHGSVYAFWFLLPLPAAYPHRLPVTLPGHPLCGYAVYVYAAARLVLLPRIRSLRAAVLYTTPRLRLPAATRHTFTHCVYAGYLPGFCWLRTRTPCTCYTAHLPTFAHACGYATHTTFPRLPLPAAHCMDCCAPRFTVLPTFCHYHFTGTPLTCAFVTHTPIVHHHYTRIAHYAFYLTRARISPLLRLLPGRSAAPDFGSPLLTVHLCTGYLVGYAHAPLHGSVYAHCPRSCGYGYWLCGFLPGCSSRYLPYGYTFTPAGSLPTAALRSVYAHAHSPLRCLRLPRLPRTYALPAAPFAYGLRVCLPVWFLPHRHRTYLYRRPVRFIPPGFLRFFYRALPRLPVPLPVLRARHTRFALRVPFAHALPARHHAHAPAARAFTFPLPPHARLVGYTAFCTPACARLRFVYITARTAFTGSPYGCLPHVAGYTLYVLVATFVLLLRYRLPARTTAYRCLRLHAFPLHLTHLPGFCPTHAYACGCLVWFAVTLRVHTLPRRVTALHIYYRGILPAAFHLTHHVPDATYGLRCPTRTRTFGYCRITVHVPRVTLRFTCHYSYFCYMHRGYRGSFYTG